MRTNMLWLIGALLLSSSCADTTQLEKEVADLKRRVTQLERGGVAKGAKAKAGKAKAGKAKAGKAKAGKAKAGKAKAGKAKAGKAKAGKSKAPGPRVVVELTGDATKVSLNNGKRGFSVPGPVPIGDYTIQAAFPGDAALSDVGTLTVVEGATVTLDCASAQRTCVQK